MTKKQPFGYVGSFFKIRKLETNTNEQIYNWLFLKY